MTSEFEKLKESNAFLNLLLDHINAAVLIVDENLEIYQFNQSFLNLFDRSADLPHHKTFGPLSGCINAVKERQVCGATSKCHFCLLRKSLLHSFTENTPSERQRLERTFSINGTEVRKILEFSSRPIFFEGRNMIMVILYDITSQEMQKRELQEKRFQLDIDLKAAAQIQKSLLPQRSLDIPGISAAWRFEPFQRVGGDIFQIYANNSDEISAYIIDVSGHGVSAAMVAVSVSQFLHSMQNRMRFSGKQFSAEMIMKRLIYEFPFERFDCFFTAVYLTLNIRNGRLAYANAGHVPPVVLHTDGALEILTYHGPVVGAGTGFQVGQRELTLGKGDRVFLYTDGLLENLGASGEAEGKRLFYKGLRELRHLPLAGQVTKIFKRSMKKSPNAALTDDISLLAIEYTN